MKSTQIVLRTFALSLLFARRSGAGRHRHRHGDRQDHRQARRGRYRGAGRRAGRHGRSGPRNHRRAAATIRSTSPATAPTWCAPRTRAQATLSPRRRAAGRATSPSTTWPPRCRASPSRPMCWRSRPRTASSRSTERYFVHNTSSPPPRSGARKSFEIVLPADAVVDGVGGTAPQRPAHHHQARPGRAKGPLRVQLPHPARRRRQETRSSRSSITCLTQRQVHLQAAGDAAGRQLGRAAAQEHDLHRWRGRGFQAACRKIPAFRPSCSRMPRPARRSSSPSPAPDRCRAKSRARRAVSKRGMGGQDNGGGRRRRAPRQPARRRHRQPHQHARPAVKYKWWILGGLALLLVAAAAFLLRKPAPAAQAVPTPALATATVPASPHRRQRTSRC